jgi:serine/threonine protein kinase
MINRNRRDYTGQTFGGWTLEEPLGDGGNGDVYVAKKSDINTKGAIKILRYWGRTPLARFRDEIEAMKRCAGIPGVMPVLDSHIPNRPSKDNPPWFVMPIATPLKDALSIDSNEEQTSNLRLVIEAMHDIAAVLAAMHEIGVSHRDIKPDNLFKYEGAWSVGDFGLAHFEDKVAETREGEKLGPMYYIAPEMLNEAKNSDGKAADVYSLAKTLWVLATGQKFPLPGQHVGQPYALNAYITDPCASLLDRVLTSATSPLPEKRPSMAQFQAELDAWLHPSQPTTILDSELDLSEFAGELEGRKVYLEMVSQAQRRENEEQKNTRERTREFFRPYAERLKTALENGHFVFIDLNIDNRDSGFSLSGEIAYKPVPDWSTVRLKISVALIEHQTNGAVKLESRYVAEIRQHTGTYDRELWQRQDSFLPGGSQEESKLQEIAADIVKQFKPSVDEVVKLNQSLSNNSEEQLS